MNQVELQQPFLKLFSLTSFRQNIFNFSFTFSLIFRHVRPVRLASFFFYTFTTNSLGFFSNGQILLFGSGSNGQATIISPIPFKSSQHHQHSTSTSSPSTTSNNNNDIDSYIYICGSIPGLPLFLAQCGLMDPAVLRGKPISTRSSRSGNDSSSLRRRQRA